MGVTGDGFIVSLIQLLGFKVLTLLDPDPFPSSLLLCYSSYIENPKYDSRPAQTRRGYLQDHDIVSKCAFSYVVVLIHPLISCYMPAGPALQEIKMISVAAVIDVPFSCDKSLRKTVGCPRTGNQDQGGIEAHERWIVQIH